ncbi:MAG: hypothetical protein KME19_25835 [Microcoleus vaginatus WJT46-NPBG5]|jgi:hypothetical protein|nr:hypothetical protein [Microcoleus vaginatus WJT46-NPBG5]
METQIQQILATLARLEQAITRLQNQTETEATWLPLAKAAEKTGFSPRQMRERIRDGRWKYGKHFIDTSDGGAPRYRINISAVQKLASTPPEKRKTR